MQKCGLSIFLCKTQPHRMLPNLKVIYGNMVIQLHLEAYIHRETNNEWRENPMQSENLRRPDRR